MSRRAGRFPGAWHMGSHHRVLHGEVRSCLQDPQGLPPRWAAAAPVARASNATSNTARSRAMVASDQCDDELRWTLQIGSGEAPHKRCCIASLRLQQACGQGAARRLGNRLRALGQGDARDTLPLRSSAALQIAAAAAVRLQHCRRGQRAGGCFCRWPDAWHALQSTCTQGLWPMPRAHQDNKALSCLSGSQ